MFKYSSFNKNEKTLVYTGVSNKVVEVNQRIFSH